MTVIYSVSLPKFGLQVGDRRVTRGAEIHNERANKAVVYRAPDGLVSISYTGLAFIEGVPTDEWLVSTITGELDLVEADGRMPIRMGPIPRHPDIGQAIWRIREALTTVIPRLDPAQRRISLELDVLGWQWKPRPGSPVRRILWNLKAKIGAEFRITRRIRRWPPRRKQYLSSIGDDRLTDDEFGSLARTVSANDGDLDAAEEALAAAVRQVAERTRRVGPDVTAVAMPHPAHQIVRIRFIPASPTTAQTPRGDFVEVGFVPWMVGDGLIAPPAAVVGGMALNTGGFRIQVDGPRPDRGLLAAWSSQERRRE